MAISNDNGVFDNEFEATVAGYGLEGLAEPAGALKPKEGVEVPSENNALYGLPTGFEGVDWNKLNQSFGSIKSTSPEDTPIIAKTPSGMVITEGDVNQAINVGMGAGPGIIAGVRARTAKLGRLGTGATGDELFQKTGWWKGGDGKYRYEISDEGMKLVDKDWRYGDKGVLGDFIEHPELFKAYPEFKNIKFEVGKKGDEYIASFNPNTKTIKINPDAIKEGDEGIKDILIHEIQHAVQTKEGFAMGSNPTYAADQALAELAERIFPLADGPQKKELLELYGELKKNKEDFGHYMYLRSPGEIEANIVAARRLLSDEMRKKFPVEEHKKMIEGEKSNYGNTYLPEFWYPKQDTKPNRISP